MIFRYGASKYCHAISYANGDRETSMTVQMRERVHEILRKIAYSVLEIAKRYLTGHTNTPSESIEWFRLSTFGLGGLPEALKISAEASHEYMGALGASGYVDAKRRQTEIGLDISDTLDLLLLIVGSEQKGLVYDMKASLQSFLGEY